MSDSVALIRDGPTAAGSLVHCPVLRAAGIIKSYRRGVWPHRQERAVLNGVDLELCAGEIVGLVGENGSGKSTLMKILVGALDSDAGAVEIAGKVGYCPQEPLLYERLTCEEHLGLFGVAYQLTPDDAAASAEGLYESLGFGRWRDTQVAELSGGTRAKLNLERRAAGRSVLVVSHFVTDQQRFDRLVEMRDGKAIRR
jgi:ABC-type multidrug transport system ATPase subunit